MWKILLQILEWIKTFLIGKIDIEKKQEEINKDFKQQLEQEELKIEEYYEKAKKDIPTDGSDLVDYWRNRMSDKTPD
jgi:hypothetical protein